MDFLSRIFQLLRANTNFTFNNKEKIFSENTNTKKEEKEFYSKVFVNNNALIQYYANLEIPYGSDLVTTKKAWKQMMKKYHPDMHARDPEKRQTATILTQELTKAYSEILKELNPKNIYERKEG